MSCYCRQALQPLVLQLPALNVSASLALSGAGLIEGLAAWLGARALPAAPWSPDPNWLELLAAMPRVRLNASAMATISALAQLRAQVLAQFGLDLLLPGQALAFARLVATLQARVSAMETAQFNPAGWLRLAALNGAIDQITLALQAGLLPPSPQLALSLTMPGGQPMAIWRALLAALRALVPLIAAAAQLNVSLTEAFTAQLAAALRIMRGIMLPGALGGTMLASLTAALSAVARLQVSLGVAPLELGFPAVHAMVQARLSALLPSLSARLALNISATTLLAELLALLPQIPYCPTSFATVDVMNAALAVHAQSAAALDWNVPPAQSLAAIRIGLPAVAFAAQVQAALGINAALAAPCPFGCDAAAIAAGVTLAA